MEPIKEKEKKQRQNYYQKNKEKMNRIARERYQKKREEPGFYQSVLEKNQKAYYKKTHRVLTPEEEEEYFQKIRRDIASNRETTPESDIHNHFTYEQIHEMFFTV
jgi:hypothetical protein